MSSTLRSGALAQEFALSGGALQRESERLKLLLDMTNSLISNLEPRDLLRAISTSIRQCMHCDIVGVWFPDAERCQMRALTMDVPEGNGFLKEDSLRPIEGSGVGRTFETGKPIVVTKATEMSEPDHHLALAEGITSGCSLPLISRKARLQQLLSDAGEDARLRFVGHFDDGGEAVLRSACRLSLEGIVSKRSDALYESGRTVTWAKSKCRAGHEVVIGGWLTTVVGRVSLDMLRSRRSRREEPLEVRLPDPIVETADGTDPEHFERIRGATEPLRGNRAGQGGGKDRRRATYRIDADDQLAGVESAGDRGTESCRNGAG